MSRASIRKLLGCALLLFRPLTLGAALEHEVRSVAVGGGRGVQQKGYAPCDIVERDVAIVGGGSAGIYTAIGLHDRNKSVVVIERSGVIGGHAEIYTDPSTGKILNLGFVVIDNTTTVNNYFARLNVAIGPTAFGLSTTLPVDFSTGQSVEDDPVDAQALGTAFANYAQQLLKYPSVQQGFNLTYPVDEDLLLPFGDFIVKYGLEAMVPTVFLYNQGYAPLLNLTTLYMFKYLNLGQLGSFANGYLMTASGNSHELYDRAAEVLGSNILYNASISFMNRSGDNCGVEIAVATPGGCKLVRAKKLVTTAPPKLENLQGYDLSDEERTLFSQFFSNSYYSGIIKNSGVPSGTSFQAVSPGQPYNISTLPGVYTMSHVSGTDLTQVFYGSPTLLDNEYVKSDIFATLGRIDSINSTAAEFVAFVNHSPFNMMVSTDAIKDGFYQRLLALQGQRNTFYAGAAWQSQYSSVIWPQIEEAILPLLLAQL